MLVFGDSVESAAPSTRLDCLEAMLRPGSRDEMTAHTRLVHAFVLASELVQGILDAEFAAASADVDTPVRHCATRLMMSLARSVDWSWRGRAGPDPFGEIASAVSALRSLPLPARILCKTAEGFAFYALYPESYLEAAAGLAASDRWRVIGIRSIGTGLAALVSVGLGAEPPLLVRPIGENAQRRLALSPSIAKALVADTVDRFAIVDEGPGLSGGSFGCVADYLERHGIARERICFFPSHPGDLGPMASDSHRHRWSTASRHYMSFERFVQRRDGRSLSDWVRDLTGTPQLALLDISSGAWRSHRFANEDDWPAVDMARERRKYLLRSANGTYLLKFAGLGHYGEIKHERAALLSQAGFTPPFKGLCHGFLVERWIECAEVLDPAHANRAMLIARLADYLAFRVRHFAAPPQAGASLQRLGAMLCETAEYLFGAEQAAICRESVRAAGHLEADVRRVATDNRLQAWEWLQLPDGTLLKTDAVDHCQSHDLIGCQDIACDVAGAAIEFALTEDEILQLMMAIEERCCYRASSDLVAFLLPCYLAFQCDSYVLAARASRAWPDEVLRLHRRLAFYKQSLWTWINSVPSSTERNVSISRSVASPTAAVS
jgi:hypothetical protein